MKRKTGASPNLTGVFVPDWLLRRRELGGDAKLTYALLARKDDAKGGARGHARELAREIGIRAEQMLSHLVELERAGLIKLKRHGEIPMCFRCTFLLHPWMGVWAGVAEQRNAPGKERSPRRPLSRHQREVCEWYTAHLVSIGRRIVDVGRFAGYLYWTGRGDGEISSALAEFGGPAGAGENSAGQGAEEAGDGEEFDVRREAA